MWTLIGYFPKRRITRSHWVSPYPEYPDAPFPVSPPVEEICSVSSCIAKGPGTPTDDWPYNPYGGYDSSLSAWQAVAWELRSAFEVFAYRLGPKLFRDGDAEQLDLPRLDVAPLTTSFSRLGYDAVEFTDGQNLGCSPLSCNGQMAEAALNRYCLVATEQEATKLAHRFSVFKPEPGPYCVVEVWRDSDQNSAPEAG